MMRAAAIVLALGLSSGFGAEGTNVPAAELFVDGAVWRLQLEIPDDGMKSLRRDSRQYVRATLREGTNVWRHVGVRLKGATGSYRALDSKPAFTVSVDQFADGQRFHGLSRIQLNNSAEDPSYLHEKLGSELFRAARVPAPRVSHAVVELNRRRLGLYVLKEGFSAEFLAQHFARADGNLYEAEPDGGRDVNEPMRRNIGAGVNDRSDLHRLADAVAEPDLALRWARLSETLDMERFLSFMAMESLSVHRDGYGAARNNFRLYHDPATERFVFVPDGMDQVFGRADWLLQPRMAGVVASAVMETPSGQRAYRERAGTLFTNLFQVAALTNRVQTWAAGVTPGLTRAEARSLQREAADFCERIEKRALNVAGQLAEPQPASLRFTNGIASLNGWHPVTQPDGGKLDRVMTPDGRAVLRILAGPITSASWRTKVSLDPGRYRFEGLIRVSGVKPMRYGRHHGATLAVTGRKTPGARQLTGDADWTQVRAEFEITNRETDVELLCFLRASAGEACFDPGSLQLVRLGP